MPCPRVCRRTWTCRVVVATVIILVFIALALGATMVILRLEKSSTEEASIKEPTLVEEKIHFRTHPVPPHPRDKVYLISIGDDFGGIEARGPDGELIGLASQLIPIVCKEAGINCETVYSSYSECWLSGEKDSASSGGRALMDKWFDTCFGWFVTLNRIAVFSFAKSLLQREKAFFFHRSDTKFDPQNIIGKRIGFIRAWAMNANCIRNKKNIAGANIPKDKIEQYNSNEEGILAVQSRKIDALFAAWSGVQKLLKPHQIAHSTYVINCVLEGSSVMSRKDSDFPSHWNVGFQKARASGKFHRLCQSARIQFLHLGSYSCIDEDVI